MRRLLPLLSSLLAVLLLSQWAGAGAACLHGMDHVSARLCVAAPPSEQPSTDPVDRVAATLCPLCAPLAPAILTGPVAVATPRATHIVIVAAIAPTRSAPVDRPASPLQARAPPTEA